MSDVLCGSHIPVLSKLVSRADKPILELGIGYSSTPLLHWCARERDIPLYSFETDGKWLNKFKEFETDTHKLSLVQDWDSLLQSIYVADFSIVFIDQRPARKRRSCAYALKDSADYVVLHDSELADHPAYKYSGIYQYFSNRYEFRSVGTPYTMVLSNRKDLTWLNS